MFSLIIGESAIFTIFVVAYMYYIGGASTGRRRRFSMFRGSTPSVCSRADCTICSRNTRSSADAMRAFGRGGGLPSCLASSSSSAPPGMERADLHGRPYHSHQPFRHNLLLARRPACHARVVGLLMLSLVMIFTLLGRVEQQPRRAHQGALALLAFRRCGVGRGLHRRLHGGKVKTWPIRSNTNQRTQRKERFFCLRLPVAIRPGLWVHAGSRQPRYGLWDRLAGRCAHRRR